MTAEEGDTNDEEGASLGSGGPQTGPLAGLGGLIDEARYQIERASYEAAHRTVIGRSGGGSVEVQMSGNLDVLSVKIAREVVDPGDVALLEDLVLAALRDALTQAVDAKEAAVSSVMPAGLDIGAMMSGLFGGADGGDDPLAALGSIGALPDLDRLFGGLFGIGTGDEVDSEEEEEEEGTFSDEGSSGSDSSSGDGGDGGDFGARPTGS